MSNKEIIFKWEEVSELKRKVLDCLRDSEFGLTDNELTANLFNNKLSKEILQHVCRQLDFEGKIDRIKNRGAEIRNFYIKQETGRLSVKRSDDLEAIVLSVLKKNEGMSANQIFEKLQSRGISKLIVSEICKQLGYKGLIKRVPGNPYLHYLK